MASLHLPFHLEALFKHLALSLAILYMLLDAIGAATEKNFRYYLQKVCNETRPTDEPEYYDAHLYVHKRLIYWYGSASCVLNPMATALLLSAVIIGLTSLYEELDEKDKKDAGKMEVRRKKCEKNRGNVPTNQPGPSDPSNDRTPEGGQGQVDGKTLATVGRDQYPPVASSSGLGSNVSQPQSGHAQVDIKTLAASGPVTTQQSDPHRDVSPSGLGSNADSNVSTQQVSQTKEAATDEATQASKDKDKHEEESTVFVLLVSGCTILYFVDFMNRHNPGAITIYTGCETWPRAILVVIFNDWLELTEGILCFLFIFLVALLCLARVQPFRCILKKMNDCCCCCCCCEPTRVCSWIYLKLRAAYRSCRRQPQIPNGSSKLLDEESKAEALTMKLRWIFFVVIVCLLAIIILSLCFVYSTLFSYL